MKNELDAAVEVYTWSYKKLIQIFYCKGVFIAVEMVLCSFHV